jgi:hypothetical protein
MKENINLKREDNDTHSGIFQNIIHNGFLSTIVKSAIAGVLFLAVGYYTLWLSNNYVKKETFDAYTIKQDHQMTTRFDSIQNKLEIIINQQTITTEQFKNLNLLLNTQQKSLDNLNDRLTYLERNYFKPKPNEQ